jgi:hypothetical protein
MRRKLLAVVTLLLLTGCPLRGQGTFDVWWVNGLGPDISFTRLTLEDAFINPTVVIDLLESEDIEPNSTHIFADIPRELFPSRVAVIATVSSAVKVLPDTLTLSIPVEVYAGGTPVPIHVYETAPGEVTMAFAPLDAASELEVKLESLPPEAAPSTD